MSRALDKSTRDALNDGDHEEAFDQIATVLLSETSGSLLEIELLGYSHSLSPGTYFLQDGNAVAIPKLWLVQAFVHARRTFKTCKAKGPVLSDQTIRKATAVILLFDPEHLTAANTRKRILEEALSRSEDSAALLMREKMFIDSLLTSRLHRHTKSPNLWSHRRWLMERYREAGLAIDAAGDLRTVVFVSAERHPRNYYAWCHARLLIGLLESDDKTRTDAAVSTILGDTKRWCFGHHNDISGWMFLLFLLEWCPAGVASVLSETMQLTESFRWRNESVWCFLRSMMLAARVAGPQEEQFYSAWQAVRKDTQEDSQERRVLDGVSSWMQTYSAKKSPSQMATMSVR
ncbi:prenyltransferase [Hirsutella rhossiliensis]|uniref:Prenyltransferase n=1 Tax=Hirsutella rhossiliensis TaxID=111463 RepID=A0A9P8SNU2_9HYPO|nr:prenyltransferase [Hirsutella rhossiliensis]KAH0968240.1 prenyltransferase [Hirsutella rhossiliensis]